MNGKWKIAAIMAGAVCLGVAGSGLAADGASAPHHVDVWHKAERFAGWPANGGAWSWGNEILVGFHVGHLKIGAYGHPLDPDKPQQHLLGRSLDGGETWCRDHLGPGLHPRQPWNTSTP